MLEVFLFLMRKLGNSNVKATRMSTVSLPLHLRHYTEPDDSPFQNLIVLPVCVYRSVSHVYFISAVSYLFTLGVRYQIGRGPK